MNDNAINHVDLQCLSCGCNLIRNDLKPNIAAKSTYKLFYIYRGSCVVNIEGVSHKVDTDCSVLVFPFQKYFFEQADDLKYYWLEFTGFQGSALVSQTAFNYAEPVVGRMNKDGFEFLFEYPECGTDETYDRYRNAAVVLLIFSFYLEHFPGKNQLENDYVYDARVYIEEHFSDPGLNVNTVVNYLKLNRSYFYRLFKTETGISPVDYINRRRISRAESLLTNRRMSIKDVAYSVGYTDQMYFSRVFKRLSGKTPTEYRNSIILNIK